MDRSGQYEVEGGVYQDICRMEVSSRRREERNRRTEGSLRTEDYILEGEGRTQHEDDEGSRMMNDGLRRMDEGGMKRMNDGGYSNERLELCVLTFFYLFCLVLCQTFIISGCMCGDYSSSFLLFFVYFFSLFNVLLLFSFLDLCIDIDIE